MMIFVYSPDWACAAPAFAQLFDRLVKTTIFNAALKPKKQLSADNFRRMGT
jgi:hypothetical protein